MKNNLKISIAFMALVCGAMLMAYQLVKPQQLSPLTLANIAAITQIESDDAETDTDPEHSTKYEECSRAIVSATCYDQRGFPCSTRVVEVEKYERTSVVIICYHQVVTYCQYPCAEKL